MNESQNKRWAVVMNDLACLLGQGKLLVALQGAVEYSRRDPEFLEWWLRQAQTYKEPFRSRVISLLRRAQKSGRDWNFEEEFRKSFN